METGKAHSFDANNVNALLELMAAYQKSQVLFTFVELDIAGILSEKPLTAAEIARVKNVQPMAYKNSDISESFLIKDKEFYLGGQVERHRKRSSEVWAKLTESLKNWQYGDQEKSAPESDDQGAEAMAEQHNLALLHGFELGKAFDFSNRKRILDLGGGTGATSIALCKTYPKLESIVFDLPENIEIAREFVAREELQNRISLIGGDFKKDDLPDNFDAVLLANFMAVADAEENKQLLRNLHAKLPAGGACILSGWIMDDSRLAPELSVLFCLEDICWDAPDVERSESIYSQWLKEAGFTKIESKTYLEPTKMLYGFKV
jgi:predicted O-methyltransferase YrrM